MDEPLIEVKINPDFHISALPLTHTKKFTIYIPPAEQCIPTEAQYFGLETPTYGNIIIDQQEGKIAIPLKRFIETLIEGNLLYAFETITSNAVDFTCVHDLGWEIKDFCRDSCIPANLLNTYSTYFLHYKNEDYRPHLAYRYGTILKRLYRGVRTADMENDEWETFHSIKNNKIKKSKIEMLIIQLDFDLQELESLCCKEEMYPTLNMSVINDFLVRVHKQYLKV